MCWSPCLVERCHSRSCWVIAMKFPKRTKLIFFPCWTVSVIMAILLLLLIGWFAIFLAAQVDLMDEDSEGEDDPKVSEDLSYDCSLDLKKIEDDPLLDDSLNLQNLGLSDVCLATIASEANAVYEKEGVYLSTGKKQDNNDGKMNDELKSSEDIQSLITVSEDDYENLPKHMKSLASWQELVVAVEKMNSYLDTKKTRPYSFQQAEIVELGLGHKARSYLLLLIRMGRVIVETSGGLICYRIL
ncbi:uncharacterized protein LOC107877923 isoform X4 [Capsicum annuum]|uniref:uncharacterized protein LOC107877923 isoform X4 n=1 Tax=Capsicum annuum TaxID=4072 RepID=UPI0007BF9286|nr:uncharacterized protein LOC107877923 isoform X4 [Capsicum annuum]